MIARSVKRLRRHGLLRKPVDIAIDFHDICRYDKNPGMKFMGYSKHKNGTRLFNALASVHCVTEGARACLGVLVRTRDVFPAYAVAALLDVCGNNGIKGAHPPAGPRVLLGLDDEPAVDARDITWLMPAVKTATSPASRSRRWRGN